MMVESRDPTIKLFGMKIPFPAVFKPSVAVEEEEVMELSGGEGEEDKSAEKVTRELSEENNNSQPETRDKEETTSTNHHQIETDNSGSSENNQQTTDGKPILKKPTKILPCPRCKSMDTKFCYYNNYNINQPRHFCKACQRYWTAGGIMRNVPVGAGRRKNKSSSSHYRHITISHALEAARLDPGLQPKTRVLSFGLEAPVSPLQGDQRLVARVENGDDCSSGSTVTTSNNHAVDESRAQPHINTNNNMNGYACIPGVPWQYSWNPGMSPPGFYPPPGYPMPFYPYLTIPVLPPRQSSSSPMSQKGSNPNPPPPGKYSGDEESAKEDVETEWKQKNVRVLVPKTLRIDDPNEAAKSSIWTTLGIKNEGISKGGMFKGFDQKMKKNNDSDDNSPLLSANPAALSRSLNFHERI